MTTNYNFDSKIWLQGIGLYNAIKAESVKPGNILVWNFGYKSKVLNIVRSSTGKTVTITTESNSKQYKRRFNSDRLLAIESK